MGKRDLIREIKEVTKRIFRMMGKGFGHMFRGLLSDPKKFILFLGILCVIIVLSYYMTLVIFLVPMGLIYAALWIGRATIEKKRNKRIGILGTIILLILTLMLITPLTLGYIIYENSIMPVAKVSPDYTDAGSGNGWKVADFIDLSYPDDTAALFVNSQSREYEFRGGEKPPYNGVLIVITVKSVPLTTSFPESGVEEMGSRLEGYILDMDAQGFEGLVLDHNSKKTGSRTIKDGHETQFFEYSGKIERVPTDPLLSSFVKGGKIKIRGETWSCSETGTIVSAAGSAQYGYTFEKGTFKYDYTYASRDYPDDYRTWTTLKNLISNVVCT